MSEDQTRPDAAIAKEFWEAFTARNRSIIVDLMYGQLKSTVTCLTCGKIALNFDPYLSIQLPIPAPAEPDPSVTFRFVKYQVHEDDDLIDMKSFEVTIKPKLTILDVKKQIIDEMELTDVKLSELIVCNQR